jgi:malate synthase
VWQWLHHGADVGGAPLTAARLRTTLDEETQALDGLRVRDARELFLEMSLAPTLAEFLTIPAYDLLET